MYGRIEMYTFILFQDPDFRERSIFLAVRYNHSFIMINFPRTISTKTSNKSGIDYEILRKHATQSNIHF